MLLYFTRYAVRFTWYIFLSHRSLWPFENINRKFHSNFLYLWTKASSPLLWKNEDIITQDWRCFPCFIVSSILGWQSFEGRSFSPSDVVLLDYIYLFWFFVLQNRKTLSNTIYLKRPFLPIETRWYIFLGFSHMNQIEPLTSQHKYMPEKTAGLPE